MTRRRYRTHQYGSVFKRGKRKKVWVARWYEDATGPAGLVRIRRSEVIGLVSQLTKGQAEQILSGRLRAVNTANHQPNSSLTLEQFVEREWKPVVLPTLKKSTRQHYKYVLDSHLLPAFGHLQLRDISRETVQAFLGRKQEDGLSWKTVRHLRTVFVTVLGRAHQWDYVEDNVVRKTMLPRRKSRKEKSILTADELRGLLSELKEPCRTLVYLLVVTGLRIGELLALRWRSVNLTSRELTVTESVYEGEFDDPKTGTSRRRVPLSPKAVGLLSAMRPKGANPEELIFASKNGTPLNRRNLLRRELQPKAEALGLHVDWHSFRHLNATLLDAAGTPLGTVQSMLGHASAEVTRGVYLHGIAAEARQAVEKLDVMLDEKQVGPKSDPTLAAQESEPTVIH